MRLRNLLPGLLVVLCILAGTSLLLAQGTDLGTIRGSVTDSQGAVVVGARVVITDVATGRSVERVSDAQGNYEVPNLKSGTYKVVVTMEGFNTAQIVDIALKVGATVRADAKLTPKSLTETVTVTSEAPAIQTDTPVISGTITSEVLTELPRDSRDIYQFLYLNPNITYNPDDGFKFIGTLSYGANFTVDSQRATGAGFGQAIGGQPSLETIGEVDVLSNSFSAEYAGIANIRVTTKRGSSQYHGSLFYDNKNSALMAWHINDKINQADNPGYRPPRSNFTETGGSFGGPVPKLKNNTFFMFAFERRWDARPIYYRATNLPAAPIQAGDFSLINDSSKPLVPAGVTLTADEVANYTVGGKGARLIKIPPRLLNPYTTALVSMYFPKTTSNPAQINPTNGRDRAFAYNTAGLVSRPLYTARLDHDFSDRDKVYGVAVVSTQDGSFSKNTNPYPSFGTSIQDRQNETVSLSWNHMFTPTLLNEARGGLNYQDFARRGNIKSKDFLKSIGFDDAALAAYTARAGALAPEMWGTTRLDVGGYAAFGNWGRGADRSREDKMWSVGDTLTWVKGKHSIRTGADIVHNFVLDGFSAQRGNPRGRVVYGANLSGWAAFLMGRPPTSASVNRSLRNPMMVHNFENGFFLQDDWKISKRLTLNLGLRYELITPFIEENGEMVNFDPNYPGANGQKGRFVVPSEASLSKIDQRMVTWGGGAVTAKQMGLSEGLLHADTNNLAPRIGAAYRIGEKGVVRAGYGIYFPTSAAQGVRDALTSSPFNQGITFRNTSAAPLGAWPYPFTGGVQGSLGSAPSANAIPFDLQQPRLQQFNLTFERELMAKTSLRVSYLGTRMNGTISGRDLNMLRPSDQPFGVTNPDDGSICDPYEFNCDLSDADQARLPFPYLGSYLASYGNTGHLRSNSLQIVAERRFSGGLMFNASYTLLDQQNDVVDADSSLGDPTYNPFDPKADFGPDSFVSRHRFIMYGVYELPFGQGRRFGNSMNKVLNGIFGGWQTSTNFFIKSATRFTPYWYCDNCFPAAPGNIFSEMIDAHGGFETSFRPIITGNPNRKSGDTIWDASAFGPPPVGADFFSNPAVAKRNVLMGPGVWDANLAIQKSFQIRERMKLTFRGVFNNVFNHPTFAPDSVWDTDMANIGNFSIGVDPNTGKVLPITDYYLNPNFGRLYQTFSHEGIADRREVRLSLRLTF